jgi:hypothetical protein
LFLGAVTALATIAEQWLNLPREVYRLAEDDARENGKDECRENQSHRVKANVNRRREQHQTSE